MKKGDKDNKNLFKEGADKEAAKILKNAKECAKEEADLTVTVQYKDENGELFHVEHCYKESL